MLGLKAVKWWVISLPITLDKERESVARHKEEGPVPDSLRLIASVGMPMLNVSLLAAEHADFLWPRRPWRGFPVFHTDVIHRSSFSTPTTLDSFEQM